MTASAKVEEESSFFEEDSQQPVPPENVVAYNELRSCADLNRMHSTGKLELQPDFQREVVWRSDEQARFIDSLVKQLPIPSMCFSLDYKTQRWKVIDGLQRMTTITSFLGTSDWRVAPLNDIHPGLRGKRNSDLRNGTDAEKKLFATVEDISIPITVIRCDYDNESHMRYLFTIFYRLNSGGVRLNNQEIRNCIYSGTFNTMLKSVDTSNTDWRFVTRRIWGRTDRFRSVEILLRALAFSERLDKYDGNLAGFLNDFMLRSSRMDEGSLHKARTRLERMASLARLVLAKVPGGKRSLTFVEGVLVGVLANIDKSPEVKDPQAIEWASQRAKSFVQLPTYTDGARYALSSAHTVKERLTQAIQAFA